MKHVGRVLAVDAGRVAIWSGGEVLYLETAFLGLGVLEPGTLVTWSAPLDAPSERVGGPQNPESFPQINGDFHRFSERGGLRYQATIERARCKRTIRNFFDDEDFIEIDVPAIVRSPGLEVHLDAVQVQLRQGMGGASTERHLSTSPEYHHKRLLSAGFERIWSMSHVFRSGERGRHHNPEFTMLEWYRAGARYPAILRDMDAILHAVFAALLPSLSPERTETVASVAQALDHPTAVMSFAEALRDLGGLQTQPTEADDLVAAFVEHVEPALPTDRCVVIDRWPASLASLARRFDDRPELAERFEVYLCGVELANGFSELVDPVEQRARFEEDLQKRRQLGLSTYPIDEAFLAALREGCPAAAGVAVGVDRLLMVLGGYEDIGDVIPFPFERA